MNHHKTLDKKGCTGKKKKEGPRNTARRDVPCESLEDHNAHKKSKNTEGCEEVKHRAKTRKRRDKTHKKIADREQEFEIDAKKRKGEGMEDSENHKRRKVDGVEGLTKNKKTEEGE
ncbi:hypothetical protein E2C01_083089 [Portunus trituberculatus]|uniref:Uncharacterized protein n=1 Tax=Portunus trituberculatus TaxID=210409 RepID=A0A5B7IW97_PORTR|nr:hypothetical protein [Portunus trituberculatus]